VSILSIRKADKCNLGLGRYRGWDWFGCLLTVGADNLDCRLLLNIPEVSANRPVHGHALGGRQQRLLAPLGLPRRCRSPALHEARRWSGERQSRHCVVGAQAPHALTIGARCIPPPGSDPESELRDELPTLFRHPAGCPVRRRCVIANEEARALALEPGSGVLHPSTFAKSWSCGPPKLGQVHTLSLVPWVMK